MKIAPATALAVWAVGTIWLVTYLLTHYADRRLGLDATATQLIRIVSVIAGLALFPFLRKWFRAWLDMSR